MRLSLCQLASTRVCVCVRACVWSDLWEVHADGVVMPLAVAHLRDLPAPLGGLKGVHVYLLPGFLTLQEHQAAVVHEQRVVVAVHLCDTHIMHTGVTRVISTKSHLRGPRVTPES